LGVPIPILLLIWIFGGLHQSAPRAAVPINSGGGYPSCGAALALGHAIN